MFVRAVFDVQFGKAAPEAFKRLPDFSGGRAGIHREVSYPGLDAAPGDGLVAHREDYVTFILK